MQNAVERRFKTCLKFSKLKRRERLYLDSLSFLPVKTFRKSHPPSSPTPHILRILFPAINRRYSGMLLHWCVGVSRVTDSRYNGPANTGRTRRSAGAYGTEGYGREGRRDERKRKRLREPREAATVSGEQEEKENVPACGSPGPVSRRGMHYSRGGGAKQALAVLSRSGATRERGRYMFGRRAKERTREKEMRNMKLESWK